MAKTGSSRKVTPAPKSAEAKREPLEYKTVLKVSSQCTCGGCKTNVERTLKNIKGVHTVNIDFAEQKATVVGNVDSETLIKELKRKTGKHAELWPQVQGRPEAKPAESKPEYKKCVLKVPLHCEIGCPKDVEKTLRKIEGVHTVNINFTEQKVTVEGYNFRAETLIKELKKKMGKHAKKKVHFIGV